MRMMNFERIETSISRVGDLNVTLMLLPNRKQANSGNLLTASYVNTYSSQKYNDQAQLQSLSINFNTYINFEYLSFIDNNRISESVLVSYPHLGSLRDFLENANGILGSNYDDIYTETGIGQSYNEVIYSEALVAGKKLGFIPAYIDVTIDNITTNEPGVLLIIKDENYVVEMTLGQFFGMVQDVYAISDSFALRTFANQLYTMGQMDYLINNSSGGVGGTTSGLPLSQSKSPTSRTPFSSKTSGANQPNRGLRRSGTVPRRSTGTGGLGNVNTAQQPTNAPNIRRKPTTEVEETTLNKLTDEIGQIETYDEEEASFTPEKAVSTNTNPLTSKIMEQAANEEFDLNDDDIDF